MLVLGVDPGLRATGVAVAQNQKGSFKIRFIDQIKTNNRAGLPERLHNIFLGLEAIIDKFNPEVLVLEKVYSHSRYPATAVVLGQVRGIIVLLVAMKKLKLVEYAATYVKKALTSYGGASKLQMQRMASYISGRPEPLDSEHIADAIALALAYLQRQK